jgi:hypothetical protein
MPTSFLGIGPNDVASRFSITTRYAIAPAAVIHDRRDSRDTQKPTVVVPGHSATQAEAKPHILWVCKVDVIKVVMNAAANA